MPQKIVGNCYFYYRDKMQQQFNGHNIVQLKLWEEIIGVFNGIELEDEQAFILIGNSCMVFPTSSPEALIMGKLDNNWIGKKIAVLRTDDSKRPIVVRKTKNK